MFTKVLRGSKPVAHVPPHAAMAATNSERVTRRPGRWFQESAGLRADDDTLTPNRREWLPRERPTVVVAKTPPHAGSTSNQDRYLMSPSPSIRHRTDPLHAGSLSAANPKDEAYFGVTALLGIAGERWDEPCYHQLNDRRYVATSRDHPRQRFDSHHR